MKLEPIINSLLETDLYKLNMQDFMQLDLVKEGTTALMLAAVRGHLNVGMKMLFLLRIWYKK